MNYIWNEGDTSDNFKNQKLFIKHTTQTADWTLMRWIRPEKDITAGQTPRILGRLYELSVIWPGSPEGSAAGPIEKDVVLLFRQWRGL
jgi:hypothetical protein